MGEGNLRFEISNLKEETVTGVRRALLAAAMALVCVVGVWSQEKRVVAVNVVDEQGRQVTGLTAEDFRGKFGGRPVKIESVRWDAHPRRVVIFLDISDSMTASEPRWSLALEAARQLVAQAAPETSFALVLFGTKIAQRVEFSSGRDAVREALGLLGSESAAAKGFERTALVDSIVEGLELLGPLQFGDAAFVITDAVEGSSKRKPRDLEGALLLRGVRLFGFILSYPPRPSMWPPSASSGPGLAPGGYELGEDPAGALGRVAEASGGSWYAVISGERFRSEPPGYWYTDERKAAALAAVRNLKNEMEQGYRVEIELPWEIRETRAWTLEAVDRSSKKLKGIKVVYPRKVAACGGGKP